jgi:hypothetical protein
MKNKGLIIGGVAVLAIGAFLLVRKRKAMASEDATMGEGKSDTETRGTGSTTTGGTGSTTTGGTGSTTTGGTGSTTTGSSVTPTPAVNVVPMPLTLKPINNAVDLVGTKLGTDIGLTNASTATLGNVTKAIVRLNSVGREVLNYISDTNSLQRATPEFKKGLDSKVGEGASKGNFATRLAIYLSMNKGFLALPFPAPFEDKTASSFDGVYFTTPQNEHAYTRTGFEIDKEIFQFNGDYIM